MGVGEKHPGGRPKKEVDFEMVKRLAAVMCTIEEIAAVLGVSVDTLERRGERFRQALAEGQAQGRASLRRIQFETAKKGNATMQVWLGKQYLEQRDKTEVQHSGSIARPLADINTEELRALARQALNGEKAK
jgi:hypothetical protein